MTQRETQGHENGHQSDPQSDGPGILFFAVPGPNLFWHPKGAQSDQNGINWMRFGAQNHLEDSSTDDSWENFALVSHQLHTHIL